MIKKYRDSALVWLKNLSLRERLLLIGGVIVLIPVLLYKMAYLPSYEAFSAQYQTLTKLQEDYKTIPFILDRYKRSRTKKEQIENEFKEVEIKEGEQSHLETILSGKVDSGFDISPAPSQAFGGNYEQAIFNVRFTTQSIESLVKVLTEVSTGDKRMLITSLNLSKDINGEKLRVELGVSSIRQIKAAS